MTLSPWLGSGVAIAKGIILTLWLVAVTSASAQTGSTYPSVPAYPSDNGEPAQLLDQGIEKLTRFLANRSNPTAAELRDFLETDIARYFDFNYMSRWAAGPYYRRMNDIERHALAMKLMELFLDALARNLGAFWRPLPYIEIYPANPGRSPEEVTVRVRVIPLDGQDLLLDFRYFRSPLGWKIYDVAANGASAVVFYRTYFSRLLRQHGPQALLY